ncbi:DNA cytosine methyltransferase [Enterobacteriaceae bacterium H11S18]|uniref:DNA cytosine methyltransferase n=1 Tax=Dryocola clanedunensis TaxID=2925396 RepID=UPI0022F0F5B9|nr:DNA cytosine methyltransferase [Dryocola clanedunensis]MCT4708792.1 DNA cytosine methyltransferase [Dryocola clanedunensis]
MTAYYNEIDQFAAQWLRNLIDAGQIAPGYVDERSIEDVTPGDLRGFTQHHFFAGVGVWSYALRQAGWPDSKPVWTGSCPCQPFSAAGKGNGFDDERHLWPAFQWLIDECKPEHIFGEQVASGNANEWFDLVQTDLEGMGYAFGLTPFTAASIGAPHIRERAYWVAHTNSGRFDRRAEAGRQEARTGTGIANGNSVDGMAYPNSEYQPATGNAPGIAACLRSSAIDGMANAGGERFNGIDSLLQRQESGRLTKDMPEVSRVGNTGGMGNANLEGLERLIGNDSAAGWQGEIGSTSTPGVHSRPLEVNGFWRDADWLLCRDGQWRPVEPGTFPLVARFAKGMGHSKSSPRALAGHNRTGRLKGYGNAINAEAAKAFIRAYMECMPCAKPGSITTM